MTQGHGSTSPQAFFIADSPQGKDLTNGRALTGFAEDTLRNFCNEHNLNLGNFWRSCFIKEALAPEVSDEKLVELRELYGPILIEEVNDLKPFLLVPLGELSFNFLTGLKNIRKFRGSVLPPGGSFTVSQENLKVLPILGPYPYLIQEYKQRIISRIDFGKIPRYLNRDPIPDKTYNIWVARSSTALRAFFDRSYKKAMAAGHFLVFDIETYMQIPICISFCFDGFESVCVPLLDNSIDSDHRALMMELVAKMLASPIPKVNQNIKYDWKILERWGFQVTNIVGDTMLAAGVTNCEFPKNLGFLTSVHTELPYFKDEGKEFDPERSKRDRYYLYNAKDSLATSQIYTKQKQELEQLKVDEVYRDLIHIMPLYRRMEDRGIRIDEMKRLLLYEKYESLFHIQELRCKRLLGRDYFNPLSPKQCKEAIFDELGFHKLRGMKTSKDGSPSTDEESLDTLSVFGEADKAPITGKQILLAIIGARKLHKVIEVLSLPLHPDGRFRCEYNLSGTETGRTSAGVTTDQLIHLDNNGKLLITNLGHSLQTVGKHGFMIDGVTYGKDLRSMFVPSPGYNFVECDLNGAEARVDRVLSGNFDMDVFSDPGIHRLTGSWVYDCLPQDIKKNVLVDGVDRYHMSKTVRHAGERNMGPDRLAMMTQRSLRECTEIMNKFHKAAPEIRNVFHKEVMKQIDNEHALVAPNGRRHDFFDRIDKHTYNKGISFLPQCVVSDQVKFEGIGKTFCNKDIYNYAHLLAESHDGILVEVKQGKEIEFFLEYKKNVETEIDFSTCSLKRDYKLIIPVEGSVGESWHESDMEEIKL